MKTRKIIQIQTLRSNDYDSGVDTEIVALCDDGTVWIKEGIADNKKWYQIEDIPQPEND